MPEAPQTAAAAVALHDEQGPSMRRRRRLAVDGFAVVLVAVVLAGLANLPGVRSSTVTATAGGVGLAVTYGAVTRSGLATPFDITVTKPGGFDAPVQVAVSQDFLRLYDENGLSPDPSSATTSGEWLLWEFEPPVGDALDISLDGRIEPAVQRGRSGAVAVIEDGAEVVRVDFRTRVLP